MQLEGVGITQPQKRGPYQLRLRFGRPPYCVVELRTGGEAADVAKKLRELAAEVESKT